MALPIIYLTGATACGKGTLGKMLAKEFNLYYISIGDLRRAHLSAIRLGVPWMAESIREHLNEGKVIPGRLLQRYQTVPAVLRYYSLRLAGGSEWSTQTGAVMIDEELTRLNALARSEGGIRGILIDGHPLTTGKVSGEIVERLSSSYESFTIVIESPRKVARQRYRERAIMPGDNEERFNQRDQADKALPGFLKLISNFGEIIRSRNDETMSIDDAFNTLLSNLNKSEAWLKLLDRHSTESTAYITEKLG
ncbi:hypothetical protein CHU98_g8180 [Xylaria longipes]|nr:hypothetical protein CHU98_g8180 [Xylaria longipes]